MNSELTRRPSGSFVAAVVSYSVGRGKWVGFELLRGSEVLALVAEEASASDIRRKVLQLTCT